VVRSPGKEHFPPAIGWDKPDQHGRRNQRTGKELLGPWPRQPVQGLPRQIRGRPGLPETDDQPVDHIEWTVRFRT
jgi:hypothetical protein